MSATATARALSPSANKERAWTSIRFLSDPSEIEAEWKAFEQHAVATLHQSYRWISAWVRSAAPASGEQPLIAVARDTSGEIAFILPFARVRRFGMSFLSWLSQDQSAYNIGLYRRDVIDRLDADHLHAIFAEIRKAHPEICGALLTSQPLEWEGHRNPIATLPFFERERCYSVPLRTSADALYAQRLSSDKRQDLRRQWRRLSETSAVAVDVTRTPEERQAAVHTFFQQKTTRVAAEGRQNLIDDPRIVTFYLELARSGGLELAALQAEGRPVATINGIAFKDRFYHLNGSIAETPLRRWSLGQLLIHDLIGRACARGLHHWDFGPGDGQHKEYWHPEALTTIDTFLAFKGRAYAVHAWMSTAKKLREELRARPGIWKALKKGRAALRRNSGPRTPNAL
ncbi:MAG: GNAT family N-acetyltransferase [Hyphomicrobium sp.]|jgi:CelD/BcsL family acetyltransferase involved in cellulose biosynthesis